MVSLRPLAIIDGEAGQSGRFEWRRLGGTQFRSTDRRAYCELGRRPLCRGGGLSGEIEAPRPLAPRRSSARRSAVFAPTRPQLAKLMAALPRPLSEELSTRLVVRLTDLISATTSSISGIIAARV